MHADRLTHRDLTKVRQPPERRFTDAQISSCAGALRALVTDITEGGRGGHPGMPLGFADVATVLCLEFLEFDGTDPNCVVRDRLVLSAGHGSALLYALLHLMDVEAFDVPALRKFRHHAALASSHPEWDRALGIDATTGPLGQGVANGVGLAIAAKRFAAKAGKREPDVFVLAGDGCIMEGICHEAASLAGHLSLDNLTLLYDANATTCDGELADVQTEDVAARFRAYGWSTFEIDGHDIPAIRAALANRNERKPKLVLCRTIIGRGAPSIEGTAVCHGTPLGPEEAQALKRAVGVNGAEFEVAEHVYRVWKERNRAILQHGRAGTATLEPRDRVPWSDVQDALETATDSATKARSTRDLNGVALAILREPLGLVGGSADLDESTRVASARELVFSTDNPSGSHIRFGVREHAMAAIANGISSFGEDRAFCATYLVFSDYMRPAMRLSCMMRLPNLFLFTHDSLLASEDGPTHQPIEHIPSLACMPGLACMRPADADEILGAWMAIAAIKAMPTALFLSRQAIPPCGRCSPRQVARDGLCIRSGEDAEAEVVIASWGSEVAIALKTAEILTSRGVATRVVSIPIPHLAMRLTLEQRREIFGHNAIAVTLFAHAPMDWSQLIGAPVALSISVESFGEGGTSDEAALAAGLDPASIAERILAVAHRERQATA
ncbi:MAG: hypothetical protein QNJ15_13400 [Erythrobacter sp.]|nr:hypothetical protein [Erythrobacter sp.]